MLSFLFKLLAALATACIALIPWLAQRRLEDYDRCG